MESNFSLDILAPGSHTFYRDAQHFISLPSGTEYTVQLGNNENTRCDVELHIDGQSVGERKLFPYSSATIERGVDNKSRFRFVADGRRLGTYPGQQGLITAIFKPEKAKYHPPPVCVNCGEMLPLSDGRLSLSSFPAAKMTAEGAPNRALFSAAHLRSGITIPGSRSNQQFLHGEALSKLDIDWNHVRELSVRLVAGNSDFSRVD